MPDDQSPITKGEVKALLAQQLHEIRNDIQRVISELRAEIPKAAQETLRQSLEALGVDVSSADARDRTRRNNMFLDTQRRKSEDVRKNWTGIWVGLALVVATAVITVAASHIGFK